MSFDVYHWDTFEEPGEDTIKINDAPFDTIEQAQVFVEMEYKGRICNDGADEVEIVDTEVDRLYNDSRYGRRRREHERLTDGCGDG